jgi:hypothetical protein
MVNMTTALNLLTELPIILNIDDDMLEEYVVKCYLALRLRPLLGITGATEQKINAVSNIFTQLYLKKDYTLDFLINAVYNYTNKHKKMPRNDVLNTDIDTFLKDYAEQL